MARRGRNGLIRLDEDPEVVRMSVPTLAGAALTHAVRSSGVLDGVVGNVLRKHDRRWVFVVGGVVVTMVLFAMVQTHLACTTKSVCDWPGCGLVDALIGFGSSVSPGCVAWRSWTSGVVSSVWGYVADSIDLVGTLATVLGLGGMAFCRRRAAAAPATPGRRTRRA